MEKLKVRLENCYGIKKLEQEFNFSNCNTFVIYAPNGIMKTSFAKIFNDYILGRDSRDQVFNRDPYSRSIHDENDSNVGVEDVFIIKSFVDTEYTSDELSTLLVRSELRTKYETVLEYLNNSKNELLKILANNTQSTDCEKEIVNTFSDLGDNFSEILEKIFDEISTNKYRDYDFRYNFIFENDVVKRFVEKNKDNIRLYYDKYFEILSKSDNFFTSDGSFGTAQATEILDSVADDSFFKAGHKIVLKNDKHIESSKEFDDLIKEQINQVLSDPELEKQFEKVDKALRPKNIQPMKKIIEGDKSLLLEMIDYDEFQRKYWKSHFSKIINEVTELKKLYTEKKKEIEEIIKEANNESEEWISTIKIFGERFSNLPFKVGIENAKDSVLGLKKPELSFCFIDLDTGDKEKVERDFLTKEILSQGEKRAFYLLNIIFEIRARLLKNQKTLFIIDDIADSFDYKNKYAIIEYLNDLSKEDNFCSIILTHNFDFFRTLQSRILGEKFKRSYSFVAERLKDEIKLIEAGSRNVTDPFTNWKTSVNNNEKHLIACIPFVRNLIDFKDGKNKDYLLLTHTLHYKNEDTDQNIKATDNICIDDLEAIFSNILLGISFQFSDKTKKITDIIDNLIAEIKTQLNCDSIVLEDKIILAIGIRLKAEKYMWSKISDQTVISGSQTGKLFQRYKDEFIQDQAHSEVIKILESVNIMTPENIHLNSFMYEPILDMGIDELKSLHDKVYNLTSN